MPRSASSTSTRGTARRPTPWWTRSPPPRPIWSRGSRRQSARKNRTPARVARMPEFASSAALRAEVLTACRVLTHFRIAEGFGHVSVRVPGSERFLVTPRRALGLITEAELVELDLDGNQLAGEGRPPLEVAMHVAVYRRRPEGMGRARGHPRHVAAYACAAEPLRVAHGFGANLGPLVPVIGQPYLVSGAEMGELIADALG